MRKFSKRTTAVASAFAAVGVVAAGTIAYAAFQNSAQANASGSGAEKFAPVTITDSEWLGVRGADHTQVVSKNLLPGESGDVKLKISNPEPNTVNGKITSITPNAVTATQITGIPTAKKADCLAKLTYNSYPMLAQKLVLPSDGVAYDVFLNDAVKLSSEATSDCQGMSFPTTFTLTFDATREGTENNAAGLTLAANN